MNKKKQQEFEEKLMKKLLNFYEKHIWNQDNQSDEKDTTK